MEPFTGGTPAPDETRGPLPPLSEASRRWLRFGLLVLAAGLLLWALYSLRGVFTPLLAALALAYILDPLVSWAQRRGVHRVVAIAALYCAGTAVLLVLGFYLVALLVEQLVELRENLPGYRETVERWIAVFVQPGATEAEAPADWWREITPALQAHGAAALDALLGFVTGAVGSLFGWVTVLVLLPMYTFFFLWKLHAILRVIRDHLPAGWRGSIVYFATTIDRAVANFFRGRLLVCLIIALAMGIGWTVVSVPYGLPLGLLAGVLSLVPFMSLLTLPPALLLAYLQAVQANVNWVPAVVMTLGVYMLVQALESFVLTPLIESRSSGLHPITTVIALLIGWEAAGLLGMLLAIPLAGTLKTLGAALVLPEIRRLAQSPPPAATQAGAAGQSGAAAAARSECERSGSEHQHPDPTR